MKKIDAILNHLKTHGSITPKDAYITYSYYRLSDGIYKLRKRGHNILTVDETSNNGETYARYVLLADVKEVA